MMHKSYVMAKIDSLRGREDLNTVLQLTGEEPRRRTRESLQIPSLGSSKRKAGEDVGTSKSQKTDELDADSFRAFEVKGTMPKKKKGTFSGGQQAAAVYGLEELV